MSPDELFDRFDQVNDFELDPADIYFEFPERIPMSLVRMSLLPVFDTIGGNGKLNIFKEEGSTLETAPNTEDKILEQGKISNLFNIGFVNVLR